MAATQEIGRIGFVSKPAHCKNHMKALQKDGFDVASLGESPTSIPPSIDVVVLRTESCSHGGSDTALAWSRSTGKRLIVENGISGIRRELRAKPPEENGAGKFTRALEVLRENRPGDSDDQYRAALVSLGISTVQLTALLPEVAAKTAPKPLLGRPYPDAGWTAAITEKRLAANTAEARKIIEKLPAKSKRLIRDAFLKRSAAGLGPAKGSWLPDQSKFSKNSWKLIKTLHGKPIRFFVLLLHCLPTQDAGWEVPQRAHLQHAYQDWTGKKTDGRLVEAAAWALEREISIVGRKGPQKATEAPVAPETPTVPLDTSPPAQEAQSASVPTGKTPVAALREETETHILDLMSQVGELKDHVETLQQQVETLTEENQTLRAQVRALTPAAEADATDSVRTLYVDGASDEAGDGSRERPHKTVQEAIAEAEDSGAASDHPVVIKVEPTPQPPMDSVLAALTSLKALGAKITIKL